jgi:thymidylate kinase
MLNVIEGPDSSGKSMLINRLTSQYDYIKLIAPGHTNIGSLIREIVKKRGFDDKSTAALMAIDWLLTVEKHNAYEMAFSPQIYISDRHPLISGLVYQSVAMHYIIELYKKIVDTCGFPIIQNLIILDTKLETIIDRRNTRGLDNTDRWDNASEEDLKKLIDKYNNIGEFIKNDKFLSKLVSNIIYVDANRNFTNVFADIDKILIKTKLNIGTS